jgi:chromosome segregation ATPase
VTPPGGAVPAPGPDPAVADLERRLRSSRAEVVTLQAEALRLKTAIAAVADSKDAEMGRLESAAIEALDSLIASNQQRMTTLEEETAASAATARRHERDLEEERRHALRLQVALTDRDERIAALANELADRERRLAERRDQAQPSTQETGSGSPNR